MQETYQIDRTPHKSLMVCLNKPNRTALSANDKPLERNGENTMTQDFSKKVQAILLDSTLTDLQKASAIAKLTEAVKVEVASDFDKAITSLENGISPVLDKHLNQLITTCPLPDNQSKSVSKSVFTSKLVHHGGKIARVNVQVSIDFDPPKRAIASDPVLRDRLFAKQVSEQDRKRQETINRMWAEMGYTV